MARTVTVPVWVLVVAVVVAGAMAAKPQHPERLTSCQTANKYGTAPSVLCCFNLWAQKHFLCMYLANPRYRRYFAGSFARNTVTSCGIPLPQFC
uniref:Uncharacterized protein n=1 Tax=Triticum urartu TaxID=4572 RepID=A0A8R7PK75_TRIUA